MLRLSLTGEDMSDMTSLLLNSCMVGNREADKAIRQCPGVLPTLYHLSRRREELRQRVADDPPDPLLAAKLVELPSEKRPVGHPAGPVVDESRVVRVGVDLRRE